MSKGAHGIYELQCPLDNSLPSRTRWDNQPEFDLDDFDEEHGSVLHIKLKINRYFRNEVTKIIENEEQETIEDTERVKELEYCLKENEASNAALESELAAAKDNVRHLRESLNKISIERDDFKKEAQSALTRVNELLSELERLGKDYKKQIHHLQEKNDKIQQLTSCIETLKLEKVTLVTELDDFKRANEDALTRLQAKDVAQKNEPSCDELRAELTSKEDEIRNLEYLLKIQEEERIKLNTYCHTSVSRVKELENCLKEKEASNAAFEPELAAMKDNVRYLHESLNNILIERDGWKVKAQSALTRVNELLSEQERVGMDYQKQIEHLQEKNDKVRQLTSCNETLKLEKETLVKERDDFKRAKEDALTRLSKAAGTKLTHGNAAITDLSDDNRPTKIAERFSEIYDNLWTDAYEELAEVGQDDLAVIDTLLQILKNSFNMCMERERSYDASITEAVHCIPGAQQGPSEGSDLLHTKIPRYVQIRKAIVDMKLALGPAAGRKIAEDYIAQVEKILQQSIPNFSCYKFPKTAEFSRQCTILCWLMRIRDPSVHIDFNFTKCREFNSDLYRQYTKSGTVANYLVWPILYLQEGGPMLAKGVAQPE